MTYGTKTSMTGFARPSCCSRSITCHTPPSVPCCQCCTTCIRHTAHRHAHDLARVDDCRRGIIVVLVHRPLPLHPVHLIQDKLHCSPSLRRAVARFGRVAQGVRVWYIEWRRRERMELTGGENGGDIFARTAVRRGWRGGKGSPHHLLVRFRCM